MTVRRYVEAEEWYPVFSLREETYDDCVYARDYLDLSDEEIADYERVTAEFEAWQTRMARAEKPGEIDEPIPREPA